ncbi:hypothetical protein OEZ85_003456 [Tetradesmus obliquus]|uniref:Regulatory protein RecX n=1 Tax=Tetradesmus obliquus TaxID=3088 RepID=A0ABY8UE93_TETOB|nr:hypothetical protein OEZ85_003456 [Tetradesmus obliquus]
MCAMHSAAYSRSLASRLITSSCLLPTAGTGAPRTLTAAAAAAEPGSRRRRRKISSSGSDRETYSISSVDDDVFAAVARLGRFLDFRERCTTEVLAKLAALGYDRELAQRVLVALQREGLQSDARFAEMFVRGYWRTKAHSPSRLAYELRSRRVAQQHIDAALASVFGPGRQLPDRAENASNEQEEEMWQQLVEMCRRRAELTRTEPQQKRRAKLASWLQRRGHTMSTIFRIFDDVGI